MFIRNVLAESEVNVSSDSSVRYEINKNIPADNTARQEINKNVNNPRDVNHMTEKNVSQTTKEIQTNKEIRQEENTGHGVSDMSAWASFLPIALMFGIFYLFLIRPQEKRRKAHEDMLKNVQVGDKVITAGGIHGVVSRVDDKTVDLEVGNGTQMKLLKNAILEIPNRIKQA